MNQSASAFVSTRPSVKVDGELRNDLQEALLAMVINLPLHGSAHAELQFSNWGRREDERNPDYILSEIMLGAEVEVLMEDSASGGSQSLFSGEITAIEENYGEGAPVIVLLLQDKLHHLARSRHNRSFEDQSPDDLVQNIASEAGLQADAAISSLTTTWHQLNESDLAFLTRIGNRFEIGIRLEGNRVRARAEEADPNPIPLNIQDSALKVRLITDLNHQPVVSQVNGYNLVSADAASFSAEAMTPAPVGTTAAATLNDLGWQGEEIVPQPFPGSNAEAEAYAKAAFRRQAKRFIQGEIMCQGEAGLKPGREIELSDVSPRLRGTYQVVHCVHRFDNNTGFETHLKVNKGGWQR